MYHRPGSVYNLREFSGWLQYEAWCQSSESQISYKSQIPERWIETKPTARSATILHGADDIQRYPQHRLKLDQLKRRNLNSHLELFVLTAITRTIILVNVPLSSPLINSK